MHHPAAGCKKKWPAEPRLGTESRLGIGGMADPATMADTGSKVVERGGFEPARRRPVGSTASFLNARAD